MKLKTAYEAICLAYTQKKLFHGGSFGLLEDLGKSKKKWLFTDCLCSPMNLGSLH